MYPVTVDLHKPDINGFTSGKRSSHEAKRVLAFPRIEIFAFDIHGPGMSTALHIHYRAHQERRDSPTCTDSFKSNLNPFTIPLFRFHRVARDAQKNGAQPNILHIYLPALDDFKNSLKGTRFSTISGRS